MSKDPFVIRADELDPTDQTPEDAPPPPEDPPSGAAMVRMAELAARPRRGGGWFWPLAGSLLSLVISVAAYDYLTGLIAEYPAIGWLALALTLMLAAVVLGQVVREVWAIRKLARIDRFRAAALAATALTDASAARRVSEDLDAFYAGRPEMKWSRELLAEQRAGLLDPDAVIAATERALIRPISASNIRTVPSCV